jgi:hypothetical protein
MSGKTKGTKTSGHLSVCAWAGCVETCPTFGDTPPGWTDMFLFRSHGPEQLTKQFATGKDVLRDCRLCPTHTIELQLKLKQLGRPINPSLPRS